MTAPRKPTLEQLREYLVEHLDYAHFTVVPRSDGAYDVALVVDGGYERKEDAAGVSEFFAGENDLPYRPDSLTR